VVSSKHRNVVPLVLMPLPQYARPSRSSSPYRELPHSGRLLAFGRWSKASLHARRQFVLLLLENRPGYSSATSYISRPSMITSPQPHPRPTSVLLDELDAGGFQGLRDSHQGSLLRLAIALLQPIKRPDWHVATQ